MEENTPKTIVMEALSTLTPPQISTLTTTISTLFHHHRRRLSALLSSHTLFSLSLHHLHSLSLHQKSLLIARHLLSILSHLSPFLHPQPTGKPPYTATTATRPSIHVLNGRDLDSVLLLLLLCELHHHDSQSLTTLPPDDWRESLSGYVSATVLTTCSGIGTFSFSNTEMIMKYVELVVRCKRFVDVMGGGGEGRKVAASVAASVAAVVALPSVEGGGKECVVCKEEMRKGRDVCELPCEHQFHWMCILPWVSKRNTCPCCRYRLPTDDVYGEIERQWEVLVKTGSGSYF